MKQFSLQTKNVTSTSVKLEKQSLLSDWSYEARVRARVTVGQWSHWSPVLTFYTGEGEQDVVPKPDKHMGCITQLGQRGNFEETI